MDKTHGSFIWDESKETDNIARHRVPFDIAADAFRDPWRLIEIDHAHSSSETRFFCIGKIRERILTVRFTYRGDRIRIFGAGYWRKGAKTYKARS